MARPANTDFSSLDLSAEMMAALKAANYETATPIQAALIPLKSEGGRWTVKVQVVVDLSQFPPDESGEGGSSGACATIPRGRVNILQSDSICQFRWP